MEKKNSRGFTLVETMVSLAVLMTVSSALFSALIAYQKSYVSTMLKDDMHEGVRGAAESLTQEIGQAGSVPAINTTVNGNITASTLTQSVSLGSTASMFVGENLQIDTGGSHESATVTAVTSATTVSAIFTKNHNSGAIVSASGVFPQGILSSSTNNLLQLFGDINGDGTLVYVEYTCDLAAGTLSRSITPIGADAKNAGVTLVQNIIANPGDVPCFTYSSTEAASYSFVTNVGLTLTTRTSGIDPQTGTYATLTKSFLNLAPRNVAAALALAQAGVTGPLQPTPSGIPMS